MGDPSNQAKAIFLAAIEEHRPGDWPAFLEQACAGDAALRAEVERLLRARAEMGSFHEAPRQTPTTADEEPSSVLESLAPELGPTALEQLQQALDAVSSYPLAEGPGSRIGAYKLLEQIGEGGFGIVFLAEQQEPLRRKVALKVLKPGMDTRQVVARFEAERQALALMDHPNIAHVFDGGATPTGRPYFVMELVKGVPLTRYCDHNELTVRQRLELFVSVCQAVQHAHQKGIIHRDLKPSNVLVTSHDGVPVVKVIDFGIAKATGQSLTDKTLFTHFAQMVGTPLYMSPEQAGMSGLDVDTRSDIYSLGVVLYELLTGTTPFDHQRLREVSYDELRRIIREEEPPRPSTRVSTLAQAGTTASAQRRSDPRGLSRLFRGELDWIVMRALEKDRNRRYESASAFAADVQRFLNDEPVLACPPSAGYRLRKFVRRNKGPVLAGSIFVLLLAVGIVGTTTGWVRAVRERNQKDAALRDVVEESKAKEEARQRAEQMGRQARQALNSTTHEMIEDLLGRQVRLTDRHRAFLKKVLAQHTAFAAARADDPAGRHAKAEGYFNVGQIRHSLGEFKEAEVAYREAAALQKKLADEFPTLAEYRYDLGLTYNNLGSLLDEIGRSKEAEKAYRDGLAIRRKLVADFPKRPEFRHELTASYNSLGRLLGDTGRLEEAEAAYRDALDISRKLVTEFPRQPEYCHDLAGSHSHLAVLLHRTGRPEAAVTACRAAVAVRKQMADNFPLVPDHQKDLIGTLANLGNLLRDAGPPKEAEAVFTEALALSKRLTADFPSRPEFRDELARLHSNLAILLNKTGRAKEAETACREAVALQKQLAADYPGRIESRLQLAKTCTTLSIVLLDVGRPVEAEAAQRDALALQKRLAAEFPERTDFRQDLALGWHNLATLLRNTGRPQDAEAAYRDAVTLQKKLVSDFPTRSDYRNELAGAYYNLAVLLHKAGRRKEAEAAWRSSLDLRRRLAVDCPTVPEYQEGLAATLTALATLLRVTDRPAEAEAAYREALKIGKRLTADFPKRADFRAGLGLTLNNMGVLLDHLRRHEEAESAYNQALALWKRLVNDFPSRTNFRQELARTSNNLGVALLALRRPREAESAHNEAVTQWKRLVADVPSRPDYRQELARSCDGLSNLLRATRRPKEAEAAWREALAVRRRMVADFPDIPDFQNELAGSLVNLAVLHRQRRELDAAVALLEEARPHHQAALKVNPENRTYRQFYRNNLLNLALSQVGQADHARAATTAEELSHCGFDAANDTYTAARFFCRCVTLAGKDPQLGLTERKELAQHYADRAMALLRRAVARGYQNAAQMRQDPELEPLRAREEYRKLLTELEGKAKE
jgi:serine/threonine protein kinase/tetratricopeptide (TPR) repeat protein